jgi:hypothetical protein
MSGCGWWRRQQSTVKLYLQQQQKQVAAGFKRLASQLYQRLRVVAQDDVLAALDAALAAAAAQ